LKIARTSDFSIKLKQGDEKMGENLGQIVNNRESEKLAGKAGVQPFLTAVKIEGPDSKIAIPPEADVIRLKGGKVKFYSLINLNIKSDYILIPSGAKTVQFPSYEPHEHNIHYGEPDFY
jgi:hypothetical protein